MKSLAAGSAKYLLWVFVAAGLLGACTPVPPVPVAAAPITPAVNPFVRTGGGCLVHWITPFPPAAPVVSWSGGCTGGYASGSGSAEYRWDGNIQRYTGEMRAGKREGHGLSYQADGGRYDGNYVNNMREGEGTYVYPDGGRYSGTFAANNRSGQGSYFYKSGGRFTGYWANDMRNGSGTYNYPDGGRYSGNWVLDHKAGQGVETLANGTRYEGQYVADQPNGTGTLSRADGTIYSGQWSNGCFRDGNGRIFPGPNMTLANCR